MRCCTGATAPPPNGSVVGFSGAAPASFGLVDRSGELLGAYVADANEALRREFGEAHLPEDVPPSAVR